MFRLQPFLMAAWIYQRRPTWSLNLPRMVQLALAACGAAGTRSHCARVSAPTLLVIDEAARVATPRRGSLKHYLRRLHRWIGSLNPDRVSASITGARHHAS